MVEGRLVAPPAARVGVVRPAAGAAAEHLAAHDPGAGAAGRLGDQLGVDRRLRRPHAVGLAPGEGLERPLVQLHAADAERVLQGRLGAGDEAFERDGEVSEDHGRVDSRSRENSSVLDLVAERERLLAFAEGSMHPDGGFGWLRTDGTVDLERPRELWINTRMTYVFALAGRDDLVQWGLRALREAFHDDEHGGWFSLAGVPGEKRAYEHVFVVLAAATARDPGLLGEALQVLDEHFWDEEWGALRDVFTRDWSACEAYRGANANMHGVEAMVATGLRPWIERARARDGALRRRRAGDRALRLDLAAAAALQPRGPDATSSGRTARRRGTGSSGRGSRSGSASRRRRGCCSAARSTTAGTGPGSSTRSTSTGGRWCASGCTGCCARRSRRPRCSASATSSAPGGRSPRSTSSIATAARGGTSSTSSNRPSSTVWDGKPDVYHALGAVDASLRADSR